MAINYTDPIGRVLNVFSNWNTDFNNFNVIFNFDDLSHGIPNDEFAILSPDNTPVASAKIIYNKTGNFYYTLLTMNSLLTVEEMPIRIIESLSIVYAFHSKPFDEIQDGFIKNDDGEITDEIYILNKQPKVINDEDYIKAGDKIMKFIQTVESDEYSKRKEENKNEV